MADARAREFPLGAQVTLEQLDADPHPVLARLREREPVSWLPALDGWLVTSHELALRAMRDSDAFTVADERFSTEQVIGPSMLSLDGDGHARHREPFVAPFRPSPVRERFTAVVTEQAECLIDELAPAGGGELRRSFAGPLAASIVTSAFGLPGGEVQTVLGWYDAIVAAVTSITAGHGRTEDGASAFNALRERLQQVISAQEDDSLLTSVAERSSLSEDEVASNAAVLLFGGIETTEGMIANAALHLLEHPDQLTLVGGDPKLLDAAIEESLRLEPAAAVIDRYATADVELGGVQIVGGELVRISIAAANRDPALFAQPDQFDLRRGNSRRHIAFAQGPHVCLGVHLARLEARSGLAALIRRLPGLRLDPRRPPTVRGLVFRKPQELWALWN